ncbi:Chloramphenicol acetyltransferase-like domain-containing protein [Artemisia annua]|uniref:Chloramphenicol acetyltransferase-like domain-containing protein n=1 Tax=Artemisia annua TaxID=35608 RepID=A0A2U1L1X2_ARTAN|nr:Chloramphenicol acetyltransferase-like domain-containing protein [Artemisia annua]
MNRIMAKLQRFGRIRQLHTIISQETIKPSSPTPPHLKSYNLSLVDHLAPNIHMPLIFFYQNYNNRDIIVLKKSLSECLTQYYPFAGRLLTPSAPDIECKDHGVEFLEASIDYRLHDFILNKEQDETLDKLIPNELGMATNKTSPNMVEVQLNHFTCGGVALAVAISHKVADAFTMANFINHWASVARGGSPINPNFLAHSLSNHKLPEFTFRGAFEVKQYATRRFVFPDSKLNELKNKVNESSTTPVNPTRVESLTSLIYKCAVGAAATTKSGSFKTSILSQAVNMRKKLGPNFPKLAAGNIITEAITKTMDSSQIKLNEVITNLRKEITALPGVRNVEEVGKVWGKKVLMLRNDQSPYYNFTSICRLPFYQVDFGWGKPSQVMLHTTKAKGNLIVLMESPSGDGIEATVHLEKEDMDLFQKDKELLAYVEDI